MPTCAECGQENPDVARFCLACGSELAAAAEPREERKVVTVLFADLVGFTSRAEQLDPEDVRAMLDSHVRSLVDAAEVLRALGRGSEWVEISALVRTPWVEAANAYARGDFANATEIYGETGSLLDEAYAQLRTAEALIRSGSRAEGDRQLQRALAFYRSVDAKAYLREGEALLAQTA